MPRIILMLLLTLANSNGLASTNTARFKEIGDINE